jgi:hypothetical protein
MRSDLIEYARLADTDGTVRVAPELAAPEPAGPELAGPDASRQVPAAEDPARPNETGGLASGDVLDCAGQAAGLATVSINV